MAYNPAKLTLVAGIAGDPNVMRIWRYRSEDAVATVRGENYISDAYLRGMREGDLVMVQVENSSLVLTGMVLCPVLTVASTGADLANGTAITMTNS